MKNIFVFPCGSELGLEIYRSLKYSIHFQLYGGSSVKDHGCFVYENHIANMPFVDSENFISYLNDIIDKYHIDIIFPAHDSVVLKCAQHKEELHCKVLTSSVKTCEIARSKKKTYEYFKNIIRVPEMYRTDDMKEFPVFLKPEVGQGSKGCTIAYSKEEVSSAIKKDSSLLILEYLPGKEYTIDCFSDKQGNLLYCQARERARILNGISANSFPIEDDKFNILADVIGKNLDFSGAWFFQVKEDKKGELCLMEIAPRIAGTMEINRLQGVNIPLMWCYQETGIPIQILKNSYTIQLDRALNNNFKLDITYNTIYVDFDDCLILNNKVNYILLSFLYKSLSLGKKIILITKHQGNIYKDLQKYRIEAVFDKIIHLEKEDEKYLYIRDENSIFIDDSFSERKKVFENKKIPVFSPDMIDGLL